MSEELTLIREKGELKHWMADLKGSHEAMVRIDLESLATRSAHFQTRKALLVVRFRGHLLKSLTLFFASKRPKIARALRIPLETPLRFRRVGQVDWCQGIAVNISSSGVLVRADRLSEIHKILQMTYVLPITIAGRKGIAILFKGEIVRGVKSPSQGGSFHFAVKILDCYPGTQWMADLRHIVGDDRGPMAKCGRSTQIN